jgi:DNA-directed RNA polymerase subunit beta
MEVWAVEAYGAANILQEFLTVKADAMEGRTRIYEAIIKGEYVSTPGIPESCNVLVQELRGLGLNIEIFDVNNNEISITPKKKEKEKKTRLI